MSFLGVFLELDRKFRQGRRSRHNPETVIFEPETAILEFRRERLGTNFQPWGLEISNICLGDELHSQMKKKR